MVKRQIDADVTILMATIGRLSEQQLQLFFLLQSMVLSYKPEGLGRLTDADVALATGALAGSLETASKGVIFEESTGSVVAEGLRRALKPVIEEVTKSGGVARRARGGARPPRPGARRASTRAGTSRRARPRIWSWSAGCFSSGRSRRQARRQSPLHHPAVIEFDVSRY